MHVEIRTSYAIILDNLEYKKRKIVRTEQLVLFVSKTTQGRILITVYFIL